MKWPEGAKVAVCLTGDIDHSRDLANGRLENILDALDDYQVKYTFPITAQVFLEDPDSIKEIINHGDEIAGHGDVHEGFRGQSYAEQRRRMEAMINVIREVSGIRVNGFRAPDISRDITTSKVADDLGLSYDGSLGISEALLVSFRGTFIEIRRKGLRRPIGNCIDFMRARGPFKRFTHLAIKGVGIFGNKEDSCLPFNPIFNGRKLSILEIPVSNMEDSTLIYAARIKNWKKIAEIWKRNFDDYHRKNGLYVLCAHPLRIGMKKYIGALKSFVEHAMDQSDAWFATLTELETWWNRRERLSIYSKFDSKE